MNELIVRVKKGVSLAVPAALDAMTTYVVLEQEDGSKRSSTSCRAGSSPA